MKRFLLILVVLLLASSALAEKVRVGGYKASYDEVVLGDSDFDGVDDRTSYYLEGVLVFSAYDTDGDGEQDMWFSYVNGTFMDVAMRDVTGDGKPENVLVFNETGGVVSEEERRNLPWGVIILGAAGVAAALVYLSLRDESFGEKKKKKK